MNPYANNKALHHRRSLELLRTENQPYPVHVQIVLSDLCNHSCSFCAYRWDGYTTNELFHVLTETGEKNHNPNRMLPEEKVNEILRDCHLMGVKALQFTGGGEPTVHPQHKDIFDRAIRSGFECALVTNGTRWVPGIADTLSQFTWVRFSLDAGTPETYSAVRHIGKENFHTLLEHVRMLSNAKHRDRTELVIGVGFVVTKENWQEVGMAARLARDAGADNLRISAVFQPDGEKYFSDFFSRAREECSNVKLLYETPTFSVSNMFGDRVEDLHVAHPDYVKCGIQQFTTYIGADQNVYRCCNLAYNPRGFIGSIRDQSFFELWNGTHKYKDFSTFDARECPRCQFNQKNRAINAALTGPVEMPAQEPTHVNFV